MKLLSCLAAFYAISCAPTRLPALQPQVQYGPAASTKPKKVLVLQATCGSLEGKCPKEYRDTVDAIVISGLEFAGYAAIDSTTLRLAARTRHEETTTVTTKTTTTGDLEIVRPLIIFDTNVKSTTTTETTTDITYVVLDGANFEDLSVDERHEVIEKSGSDSIATVRIVIGGKVGVWVPNQNVEVMVKLGVHRGDEMAWASRCTASSNDFTTVTGALEHAARCAMHGATSH
jgi:hypothetical protein